MLDEFKMKMKLFTCLWSCKKKCLKFAGELHLIFFWLSGLKKKRAKLHIQISFLIRFSSSLFNKGILFQKKKNLVDYFYILALVEFAHCIVKGIGYPKFYPFSTQHWWHFHLTILEFHRRKEFHHPMVRATW